MKKQNKKNEFPLNWDEILARGGNRISREEFIKKLISIRKEAVTFSLWHRLMQKQFPEWEQIGMDKFIQEHLPVVKIGMVGVQLTGEDHYLATHTWKSGIEPNHQTIEHGGTSDSHGNPNMITHFWNVFFLKSGEE